jgi:hypothetical protein
MSPDLQTMGAGFSAFRFRVQALGLLTILYYGAEGGVQ